MTSVDLPAGLPIGDEYQAVAIVEVQHIPQMSGSVEHGQPEREKRSRSVLGVFWLCWPAFGRSD